MEFRLGNSKRIKQRGFTQYIICPHCKKEVSFSVFSNLERKLAVKITLLDLNTVYFLVCPECASVFSVDSNKGELFKDGEISAITSSDLKEPCIFKNKSSDTDEQ